MVIGGESEKTFLVTGSAGIIGRFLIPRLGSLGRIVALDTKEQESPDNGIAIKGSILDRSLLEELSEAASVVIHLATASPAGWDSLLEVDIKGTKEVLDVAAESLVPRVILASSNHVVGLHEADAFARGEPAQVQRILPSDPIRPDSPYGASKAFGEAYARYIAETTTTSVSVLRIGTVRSIDSPELYRHENQFAHIPGGAPGVLERLESTWLYHKDLWTIISEELNAADSFRLRFALSRTDNAPWDKAIMKWNPDS
jgi:nucleoside-diphosphate-sugar epimerase